MKFLKKIFFIVFVLKAVNCGYLDNVNTLSDLKDDFVNKMQDTLTQQFGMMFRPEIIFGGSESRIINSESREVNDRYDDTKCYLQSMAIMRALNKTEMWAIKGIFFSSFFVVVGKLRKKFHG